MQHSFVWDCFGILNDGNSDVYADKYFCKPCLELEKASKKPSLKNVKVYSIKTSTGNHKQHLLEKHCIKESDSTGTKSIANLFPKNQNIIIKKKDNNFNCDLYMFLAKDCLPLQIVEKTGFSDFFIKHFPSTELPSRRTLSRTGTTVCGQIENIIHDVLDGSANLYGSATFHCWTDQYKRRSYIGMTYHYMESGFNLKHVFLACEMLPHPHTGEVIKTWVEKTLSQFNLQDKCKVFVTDNATNNIKFAELSGRIRVGCDAHGIHNMICRDGFMCTEQAKNLLLKCKRIVRLLVYRTKDLEDASSTIYEEMESL